jgi:type II secretory pathway component PulJ
MRSSDARSSKPTGFTLIEVLIAAVILFATITVVSESYRASLASGQRATTMVELLTPVPLIISTIRARIRERPEQRLTEEGQLLGVRYAFEAVSVRFEPPPPSIDFEMQTLRVFKPRYRLYEVTLHLERRSVKRRFVYQELAWLPRLD